MLLARRNFTLGNIAQYTVDYSEHTRWDPFTINAAFPIRDGDSITSATVTSSVTDVTVAAPTVYEGHKVVFKLSGGSINELFTLTIVVVTNNSETFTDTIDFMVVAP